MERVDVLLEPVRAFLFEVGAFLPRLAVALVVLLAGYLLARAGRFAVQRGYVSITPLRLDLTDHAALERARKAAMRSAQR